jgi:hypothetical protein
VDGARRYKADAHCGFDGMLEDFSRVEPKRRVGNANSENIFA